MKKVIFFAPIENAQSVKKAMFKAGAGKIGNYDSCSFETKGMGQFRALKGANPTIGKLGSVEYVQELKVEMICEDHLLKDVIMALKEAHCYEEPAIDVIELISF